MSAPKRWTVTVKTSNVDSAGTDSCVYIQLFGEKGETNDIELDNTADNFEIDRLDTFNITTKDLGKLTKLKVSHDNSGTKPGWHLEWIELDHKDSSERYKFPCDKWLSSDTSLKRELLPLA